VNVCFLEWLRNCLMTDLVESRHDENIRFGISIAQSRHSAVGPSRLFCAHPSHCRPMQLVSKADMEVYEAQQERLERGHSTHAMGP
jgi:hypothetical protein